MVECNTKMITMTTPRPAVQPHHHRYRCNVNCVSIVTDIKNSTHLGARSEIVICYGGWICGFSLKFVVEAAADCSVVTLRPYIAWYFQLWSNEILHIFLHCIPAISLIITLLLLFGWLVGRIGSDEWVNEILRTLGRIHHLITSLAYLLYSRSNVSLSPRLNYQRLFWLEAVFRHGNHFLNVCVFDCGWHARIFWSGNHYSELWMDAE